MAVMSFLVFVFVAVTTVAATALLVHIRGTSDGPGAFMLLFWAVGGWTVIVIVVRSKLRAALRRRGLADRLADFRDFVVDGAGPGATHLERFGVLVARIALAMLAAGLVFQLLRALFSRTVLG